MNNSDKMKIFYIIAILGILTIWMGGVVYLEAHVVQLDRGFITEISGICLLVLGQIANMLKNSADNHDVVKKVEEIVNK